MAVLSEPIPILPDQPNAEFLYNNQLKELFRIARNLSMVQRTGAIQNNDKAGNLNAVYIKFTSNGVANTEDAVSHKLGRTPVGYIAVKQDKSAILYDGTTAWTTTKIYLKTSVATVVWTVLLF